MDWRENFNDRFGDTFRLCCDDKTLQIAVESFIENILSNREKEIAEEVEEIQTKLHNGHLEAGYKLTNKLLSILKH